MAVKIKVGKFVSKLTDELKQRITTLAATAAMEFVAARIAEGVTIDGQPMLTGVGKAGTVARYSEQYERWKGGGVKPRLKRKERKTRLPPKYKAGKGRALYTPGDRFVLTGAMLRAWQVLETSVSVMRIGFTGAREALKGLANHLRRPTFALSSAESKQLVDRVLAEVGFTGHGTSGRF